jgi:hypothetical protein
MDSDMYWMQLAQDWLATGSCEDTGLKNAIIELTDEQLSPPHDAPVLCSS